MLIFQLLRHFPSPISFWATSSCFFLFFHSTCQYVIVFLCTKNNPFDNSLSRYLYLKIIFGIGTKNKTKFVAQKSKFSAFSFIILKICFPFLCWLCKKLKKNWLLFSRCVTHTALVYGRCKALSVCMLIFQIDWRAVAYLHTQRIYTHAMYFARQSDW